MKKWQLYGTLLLTALCVSGCAGGSVDQKISDEESASKVQENKIDPKDIDWSSFGLNESQVEKVQAYIKAGKRYKEKEEFESVELPEELEKYSQIRILDRDDVGVVNFSDLVDMEEPADILEYFFEQGYQIDYFTAESFYDSGTVRYLELDMFPQEFYLTFMRYVNSEYYHFNLTLNERTTQQPNDLSACSISIMYDLNDDKKTFSKEWRSMTIQWKLDYIVSGNLDAFRPGPQYEEFLQKSKSQVFWGTEDWCSMLDMTNRGIETCAAKLEKEGNVSCTIDGADEIEMGEHNTGKIMLRFEEGDKEGTVSLRNAVWTIDKLD